MKNPALLILVIIFSNIIFAQNDFIEIKKNSFKMHFEIKAPKYELENKGKYSIIDYYEFTNSLDSEAYKLPYAEIFIALPPFSKPDYSITFESENSFSNMIPKKNVKHSDYSFFNSESKKSKPLQDIELLGYFWIREFYCAKLRVNTHLFNVESCSITERNKFSVEIKLPDKLVLDSYSSIKPLSSFDKELKNIISNYIIAEQFRGTPHIAFDDSTGNWIDSNKVYIKIGVGEDGLYRLNKAQLETINVSTLSIDPRTFKLYESGKEISIHVSGESDGIFDDTDYIEFWGSKNYTGRHRIINSDNEDYNNYIDVYTDSTFYFLTWAGSLGKRVLSTQSLDYIVSDTLKHYSELKHVEQNTMFQLMNNDEVKNQAPNYNKNKSWVWRWIQQSEYKYIFNAPGLIKNKTATIYIKLISAASNVPTHSHNIKLSVNSIKIDSQVVNRYEQVMLKGTINSSLLKTDKNIISIKNFANGTSPNQLALDWYEYEFPRYLSLQSDSLYFQISSDIDKAVRAIEIDSALYNDYVLYKVKPYFKRLTVSYKSLSTVVFIDTVQTGDTYIIINSSKIGTPQLLYVNKMSSLREKSKQADYIAVTHKKFWESSVRYAKKISDLYSLNTEVVQVNEIYDQFGYGYPRPEAIKEYLKYTYDKWRFPKPSYVCIIGDGNYDYHRNLFKNDGVLGGGNFIPSYGYPVSDNWFIVFNDDIGLPQMKIGRLPVNSPTELEYYLSKLENNYSMRYDDWNKDYLFFSGGNKSDEHKAFKAINDSIINKQIVPPPISGNFYHFYKTQNPISDFGPYSSSEVSKAISSGGIFISYIGHSGTATWDNSISEVDQLHNKRNKNPLITDFGCSTNKFAEPDIVSFGERFVLNPRGQALGYIGNSSLGFTSTSSLAPLLFYEAIFSDSLNEVGAAHLNAKFKLLQKYGASGTNKVFCLTNMLIGDPAVRLKIPNRPNLRISVNDIDLNKVNLIATMDSVPVFIKYSNLGTSVMDSVKLQYVHSFKDKIIQSELKSIPVPSYKDSIGIWCRLNNLPGTHSISVKLDSENKLPELYEDDNEITIEFTVFSSDIRDILSYKTENSVSESLTLLNPSVIKSNDSIRVLFQYNQVPEFEYFNEIRFSIDTFKTRIPLDNLEPKKRYWFRLKIDDEKTLYTPVKSFYLAEKRNFLLMDSVTFGDQNLSEILNKSDRIKLSIDSVKLSVISAGWSAGANCIITKDSKSLLSNSFFAGMGIVVFDSLTMEVDTSQWYQMFQQPNNVIQLTNLINSIPEGKIVIMGVADDGANNLTAALKSAIKTLGSTKIDQLKFRGSWAIIGRKGAAPGDVIEEVKGPYDGSVYLDSTFIIQNTSGKLITKNIGPAGRWRDIKLSYEKPGDSKIDLLVSGINNEGIADTLMKIPADSLVALDTLDTKKYKYIKIQTDLIAASDGTSPSISLLGVDYVGVAEIGTNYQVVSISKDSLVQGDSLGLHFGVYNVGESAADSFRVKVELLKPDNSAKLLMDSLVSRLDTMSHKDYSLLYRTGFSEGTGNMKFRISMDPENKVTELYKDNNVYETAFYVKPDTTPTSVTSASLDVTFDGISITEGDYVSANPEVKFVLSYPVWFPVNDTSAVQFYIDNKQVFYSEMDFFSDTINRKVIFKYLPLLEDGEHHLRVYGKNIIGKIENTPGYEVFFQVQNEMKLLNVYNYPNPFKTNTSFTFTLTQVPDDLRIKIFTVAGRMIREINGSSYGVHAGFNAVPWDGRDEDGNVAANGVYLYKVVVKKGERTENTIQKLAIVK